MTSGRIPSRGSDQFNLRFPDGMRDKIKAQADAYGRSMNAEIIARLEEGPELRRAIETLRHDNAELKIHLQHANEDTKKFKSLLEGLRLELATGNGMDGALGAVIKEDARIRAIDSIDDSLGVSGSLLDAGALNATLDQFKRFESQLSRIEHIERLIEQIVSEGKHKPTPTKADE